MFGHQKPGFGTGPGSAMRNNAGSGSTTLGTFLPDINLVQEKKEDVVVALPPPTAAAAVVVPPAPRPVEPLGVLAPGMWQAVLAASAAAPAPPPVVPAPAAVVAPELVPDRRVSLNHVNSNG
jgi:hypothetical protein